MTTTRLLAEAALLVDWYLPAITGRAPTPRCASDYLELWRELFCRSRATCPDTLVLRDYHVDNLMLLDGRDGIAAMRPPRFPGRGDRADELRPRLAAGGRAARRAGGRSRAAMLERYLAAFPALDRAAFAALLRRPRRAAQLQDHRHLHAALRARRQAGYLAPYSARVAAHRGRSAPSRAGADGALARPAYSARLAAHPRRPERAHEGVAAIGDGARRGARHAAAAAHRPLPKPLVRVAGRALIDHVLDRLAEAGVRARRRQSPLQGRDDRAALAARRDIAIELSREESCSNRRRRHTRRCRCSTRCSSSSTAT